MSRCGRSYNWFGIVQSWTLQQLYLRSFCCVVFHFYVSQCNPNYHNFQTSVRTKYYTIYHRGRAWCSYLCIQQLKCRCQCDVLGMLRLSRVSVLNLYFWRGCWTQRASQVAGLSILLLKSTHLRLCNSQDYSNTKQAIQARYKMTQSPWHRSPNSTHSCHWSSKRMGTSYP